MQTECFFDGFLASLWKQGVSMIKTDNDACHAMFYPVATELRKDVWQQREFPLLFPNQFSGRFADFDRAILQWWRYNRITFLDVTFRTGFLIPPRAVVTDILADFTPDDQSALLSFASLYVDASVQHA